MIKRLADKLVSWLVKGHLQEEILGDMDEFYEDLLDYPSWKRSLIYGYQAMHLLRPILLKSLLGSLRLNNLGMIHLLFKLNLRQMRKKAVITAISLITLIVGVTSFQLTVGWILNEKSMDDFHSKKDRISIGVAQFTPESGLIAFSLSGLYPIEYDDYPEIEESIFIHTYSPGEIHFNSKGVSYTGTGLVTDSSFFQVFDFGFNRGNKDALQHSGNIVVTKNFAEKVFGNKDPLGELVKINCDQEGTYQVAGILDKIPSNSSINFDFLIPRHSQSFWRRAPQDIILLKENVQLDHLNEKLKVFGEESERFPNSRAFLYPFADVYNNKPFSISLFTKYGSETNLQTISLVAVALFLITIICFTNLQTSVQLSEIDKVRLKYVVGANKASLIMEWLVRAIIYLLLAGTISLLLYSISFESIVGYIGLEIDQHLWSDSLIILSTIMISAVLSAIIATTNIFRALKDLDVKRERKMQTLSIPRKALASIQYVVTILLLIGSTIVAFQLRYFMNKNLGINQSEITSVRFFDILPNARQDSAKRADLAAKYNYVLNRVNQYENKVAVTQGAAPLDFAYDQPFKLASSPDDFAPIATINSDPGFAEVFSLNVLEGRFFDQTDSNNEFKVVINESAKKYFKLDSIDNASLVFKMNNEKYRIVGVVEDFHFEHLSQKIKPLVLTYFIRPEDDVILRYRNGTHAESLNFLEELYREVNPEGIFKANFFEDKVEAQYQTEKRVGRIYSIFGFIAILMSSVTLFSFVYHETKRRTKEVGVRKVNGATSSDIFSLFSLSFLKSITVSLAVAVPIGWYIMEQWLNNFSNRIQQEWWMYLFIIALVTVWALIAISWHTLKVARTNPIHSLRYE